MNPTKNVIFHSITGGALLVLALFGLLSVTSACAPQSQAAEAGSDLDTRKQNQDERISVAAIPLTRGSIESVLRYSTNLEAEEAVEVYSEASRRVDRLLVEEGHRVSKGKILLLLEDDVQRSDLAKVESQLAKARREYGRQQKLFEQSLISEQAFSDATYEVEQLEIALGDARRELSYTEVKAPISGVVTQRLVNVGDFVQENQHLFDIVDFDTIVARIYVPEKEMPRLSVGQSARLSAAATADEVHVAAIDRIAPVVDPKSGTIKVTLAVPASKGLVPGMYVEVELVADTSDDALLVPKRALVYDQDQVFVFRIKKIAAESGITGKTAVERVRIRPVIEERNFVEVDETLSEGDLIVVAGQAGLKDNAEVRLLDLEEALATFSDGQFSQAELAEQLIPGAR